MVNDEILNKIQDIVNEYGYLEFVKALVKYDTCDYFSDEKISEIVDDWNNTDFYIINDYFLIKEVYD